MRICEHIFNYQQNNMNESKFSKLEWIWSHRLPDANPDQHPNPLSNSVVIMRAWMSLKPLNMTTTIII